MCETVPGRAFVPPERRARGDPALTAQMRPVEELRLQPEQRVQPPVPRWRRALALTLKAVVPLVILAVAAAIVWQLYQSAPVAERTPRERLPRRVETVSVAPASRGPLIEAWGEVTPARSLVLSPEISGTVAWLDPRLTEGGLVRAGDPLIRLDERELRLALAEAEAEIRQIEARIAIERGQQERAQRDLEQLPGTLSEFQRRLVLREPQMAELEGELAAAEAARDRAAVDLSHTVLRAPFDALVVEEQVAEGSMLTSGTAAATLVPADRFHVKVAVPPAALEWVEPEAGQSVRLTQPGVWPEGSFREGRIERVSGRLTPSGRMAELIVSVEDPLARAVDAPPLLLGSFVRAVIEGQPVPGAVSLDREYLRDGGTVWVATPENRLEVREVEVAWRGASEVYITEGLAPGERVVTTHLAVAAPGMALRLADDPGQQGERIAGEPAAEAAQ